MRKKVLASRIKLAYLLTHKGRRGEKAGPMSPTTSPVPGCLEQEASRGAIPGA